MNFLGLVLFSVFLTLQTTKANRLENRLVWHLNMAVWRGWIPFTLYWDLDGAVFTLSVGTLIFFLFPNAVYFYYVRSLWSSAATVGRLAMVVFLLLTLAFLSSLYQRIKRARREGMRQRATRLGSPAGLFEVMEQHAAAELLGEQRRAALRSRFLSEYPEGPNGSSLDQEAPTPDNGVEESENES